MFGRIFFILFLGGLLFFRGSSLEASPGSYTFTPGPTIALTGSSDRVFFDVKELIHTSATTVSSPYLDTPTRQFHGAFYLSGAGWVDFSTGSSLVSLDCGAQLLSGLTLSCGITGTGYAEIVGDVVFSGAFFHPNTGEITGTVSTFVGDYSLSGARLPMLPTFFSGGEESVVDHVKKLTLSGSILTDLTAWNIYFEPMPGGSINCGAPTIANTVECDLSMAGNYTAIISDSNASETRFDYKALPGVPAPLDTNNYYHKTYCSDPTYSGNPQYCPDGATLTGMSLSRATSSPSMIANGMDTYTLTLRVRDTYGNMIDTGSISIEYKSETRANQISFSDLPEFFSSTLSGSAITHIGGVLFDQFDGTATTPSPIPLIGDISYGFSSIAPTNALDSLSLSGITYIAPTGSRSIVSLPSWQMPLTFDPWYATSLMTTSPIVVGTGVGFSGVLISHDISLPPPSSLSPIYHLSIGDNSLSSLTDFTGDTLPSCVKYAFSSPVGTAECNWFDPLSVVISTLGGFSGTYSPTTPNPPLESMSYRSYIAYETGGIHILYPSASSSLGGAQYGQSSLRILGQNNITGQYGGIGTKARSDLLNTIRKNIALLSRNRTSYADTDYVVMTGAQSLDDNTFDNKKTIIVVGGDVTITSDISKRTHPLALIMLPDELGVIGDVTVDPSVRDLALSVFTPRGITSSGSSQLAILGSLVTGNTVGGASTTPSTCPSFIPVASCDLSTAERYDLEKLRPLFDPVTSPLASILAGKYTSTAVIIEYDGRILADPPPGVGK